ncbi:MAG TPA: hypothetical protein PLD88_04270 [Candidatus Berkiella sp.]|nr:hypothetical protein [Candidatus Berkiella sp.]
MRVVEDFIAIRDSQQKIVMAEDPSSHETIKIKQILYDEKPFLSRGHESYHSTDVIDVFVLCIPMNNEASIEEAKSRINAMKENKPIIILGIHGATTDNIDEATIEKFKKAMQTVHLKRIIDTHFITPSKSEPDSSLCDKINQIMFQT